MENENSNLKSITGNPKKAVKKLAIPIVLSMLIMFSNNIIDSMWVAGLGASALAALGFITPLYTVLIGIGNGIGAGVNSLMSRCVGAKKYDSANNAAIHGLILTVILSIIISAILVFNLTDILILMGASEVLSYGYDYGFYIFAGTFAFFLPAILASILRAEGDVKRSTYPLVLTAILNMILDPIFIYTLNLGIKGAAITTVLTHLIGALLMVYWIFIKKDTYFEIKKEHYKRKFKIYKEILYVGTPACLEEVIFAIVGIIFNYLIIVTAGTQEVAVFTIAWRFIAVGILPTIGVGTAALTVGGIAYGGRNAKNLKTSVNYSTLISLIITIIIVAFFFIFADPISYVFNYYTGNPELIPRTAEVLRIMSFYDLLIPFGSIAAYTYQGIGKGFTSLAITIFRELLLSMAMAYIFAIPLKMGVFGAYIGATIGISIGSMVGYFAMQLFIKRFTKLYPPNEII